MAKEFNSLLLPHNRTNIATHNPLLHSDKFSTVRHHPSAHNHAFISSYQLRGRGESFISRTEQPWRPRYPGRAIWAHPACRSVTEKRNPLAKTQPTRTSAKGRTNLPLGELQVHLTTTLSGGTGLLLERAADRTGSDGHVAVVAIPRERQS